MGPDSVCHSALHVLSQTLIQKLSGCWCVWVTGVQRLLWCVMPSELCLTAHAFSAFCSAAQAVFSSQLASRRASPPRNAQIPRALPFSPNSYIYTPSSSIRNFVRGTILLLPTLKLQVKHLKPFVPYVWTDKGLSPELLSWKALVSKSRWTRLIILWASFINMFVSFGNGNDILVTQYNRSQSLHRVSLCITDTKIESLYEIYVCVYIFLSL